MTNPEFDNDEITIDLTELLMVLWSEIHIILLSGMLMALLAFVGTRLFITPLYTSVTQMYVLTKQDNNANVTYSDLQTGTQLTKDYMVLIKSRPVMEQVISALNLDMEAEELADMISVETETDTRVLNISVRNKVARKLKIMENEKHPLDAVCFIANLPPRKLKGIVSQGMILSAENSDGSIVLLTPSAPVAPGAKIG